MCAADGPFEVESELLRQRIRLYLYGELSMAERQEVEQFRDTDAAFRALFAEEQRFLRGIGGGELDAELDDLLGACRGGLTAALEREGIPSLAGRLRGAWQRVVAALRPWEWAWQPALAAALLVAGFAAGRGWEARRSVGSPSEGRPVAFDGAGGQADIEAVRLDPTRRRIQIVVEERRTITGDPADPWIRSVLLDGLHGTHAGARLTSLEALGAQASDEEVRWTLLRLMLEDENPGVRLKALESVRDQAHRPEVRKALVSTLRGDPVEGMRIHAIQLLGRNPTRELAGALQEVAERETNPFVRGESERILDLLGASSEHF